MRQLVALVVVALPFVVTPGASFTLTLAHASRPRTATWWQVALGTGAGVVVLALAMGATGLGAALATIPVVRTGLGFVGAAVLVALGVAVLVRAVRRTPAPGAGPGAGSGGGPGAGGLVRWSFAAVVTNPKALSLYVLVVPTLAGPHLHGFALFAGFAAVHVTLLTAWLFLVHHAATRIPGLARSSRFRRALLAAAGVTMIALGVLTVPTP